MRRGVHGGLIAGIIATLGLGVAAALWQRVDEPPPPRPSAGVPFFGFNEASWGTAWQDRALTDAVTAAAAAGANTNKLTVRWFDLVSQLGASDEPGWSRYRHAYQTMIAAGIRPIVMLVGAPRGTDQLGDPDWAPPGCAAGAASPPAPEYDRHWQRFVARAAAEFPDALAFQIWNEPNSDEYWGGCDVDPARYVELVALAREALGPSSQTPIVSAGLNSAVGPPAGVAWADYLRATLDLGLLGGDGAQYVGVHPYPPPDSCAAGVAGAGRAMVDAMEAQVEAAEGMTAAPIWVTEFGASSAELPGECRALGFTGQAQVVSEMYDRLAADDRVDVAIVHQLVDQSVANPDPTVSTYWSNFGVTSNATPYSAFLQPKTAYWCLAGRRGRLNESEIPCSLGANPQ
jgi:hypothetical protein